jgi:hypothetical protein
MEKIIPAISSGVRGPAGVAHLPRLWLTAIAAATGTLAESYAPANDFDRMLTDDLSIDPGALTTFLRTVPTYQATEAWVRAHAGAADDAAIARHNASVDAAASVLQNDLADWDRLHAFLA